MTDSVSQDDNPAPKLLGAPTLKRRVAATSVLILSLGALLAPRTAPTALSTPQERAAPLLEDQLQPPEAPPRFLGVQDVVARVRDFEVTITAPPQPLVPSLSDFAEGLPGEAAAGFGVYVSDGRIMTHADALGGRRSVQVSDANGDLREAEVESYEASTGLVLLRTAPVTRPVAPVAREPLAAGMLAVALGRLDRRDVAIPVFVTYVDAARYHLDSAASTLRPGMPVYNLDGELVAIAGGDTQDGLAFPVSTAVERLTAPASAVDRAASCGLAFQNLDGPLTRTFGEKGALVSNVVAGGPAERAGLQAGDVLLAFGNTEIDSAHTAREAVRAAAVGTETTLSVLRSGRPQKFVVAPATLYEVAALARGASDGAAAGVEARALFSPLVLDQAAIPSTARVLRVNDRPVLTLAQAQRELRGGRPAVVWLQRGTNRFFAVIETTP